MIQIFAPLGMSDEARAFLEGKAQVTEDLAQSEVLWARSEVKVTRDLLEKAPRLKLIGIPGSGFDHIDLKATFERKILVCRMPEAVATSAAELTMGLMLMSTRKLFLAREHLQSQKWDRKSFLGFELSGKTLGIVGLGRIGSRVAKRALAFEMNVKAYDPYLSADRFQELQVSRAESLATLLKDADFISLHTPLTEETRGMMNDERLSVMKPSCILINAARGELVVESAILKALNEDRLNLFAADVCAEEPPAANHPFRTHPKILLTPHIGAQTKEAQTRAHLQLAREIWDYLQNGNPPQTLVTEPSLLGSLRQ